MTMMTATTTDAGNVETNGGGGKIKRLPTGCGPLDKLLDGGIEYGTITNVYGPAGSAKTNIVLSASISCVGAGKSVIFIDTEGGFSTERLWQLSQQDPKRAMDGIILLEPKSFKEQHEVVVNKLYDIIEKKSEPEVGLVVMDSLVTLYRLELDSKNWQEPNRLLANELAMLSRIAREKGLPVLITNQVYSDFEKKGGVELSAKDIPKYWSKCLIEVVKLDGKGRRLAVIRKHRSLPEGAEVQFQITGSGFDVVGKGSSTKLF